MKHSATPLYIQIREQLEEGIRSGKYPVGSKLPSEKELCEKFGVSRITVRQALELLENRRMTCSVHGKGTFVRASIIDSRLAKISTFGETLAQMGYSGYTKVFAYEEKKLPADADRLMQGERWSTVSHLALIGYSMDEPVVYYRSMIAGAYGPSMHRAALALENENQPFSTFDLYRHIGLAIGHVKQQVAAVNADAEIADMLNLAPGDAVLVLNSDIFDEAGRLIERKKGYYCTDKYSFNLNREL